MTKGDAVPWEARKPQGKGKEEGYTRAAGATVARVITATPLIRPPTASPPPPRAAPTASRSGAVALSLPSFPQALWCCASSASLLSPVICSFKVAVLSPSPSCRSCVPFLLPFP